MPAGMIGADTAALREIASRFVSEAGKIGAVRSATGSAVSEVEWLGLDRDAYVDEWHASIDATLASLVTSVEHIGGSELPAQAAAQDEASAAHASGFDREGAIGDWWYLHRTKTDDEARHKAYDGEAATDETDVDPYEITQGAIGDCWALASLAAVAKQDPGFIEEHIRYDEASNEYIVTLYENGEPVDVRVSNSFPVDGDGEMLGTMSDAGHPNYASIYEKALAEHRGGTYASIDGGRMAVGLETITGESVESTDRVQFGLSESSIDEARTSFENGEPVVLGSKRSLGADSPIVGGHMYTVTGITDDGDFILFNPWGVNPDVDNGAGASDTVHRRPGLDAGEIVVPADEIDTYFSGAAMTS